MTTDAAPLPSRGISVDLEVGAKSARLFAGSRGPRKGLPKGSERNEFCGAETPRFPGRAKTGPAREEPDLSEL
ncbi:MAG: hypothetical protein MUF63_09060, partial [Rhodobacteraceae bacterium]|nr:hypothetical protein [Paracoccaceae bacterium]